MSFPIQKILVDERVLDDVLTLRILQRCGDIPFEVGKRQDFEKRFDGMSLTKGKRILFLTRAEGDMVKPCPGTLPPYLCCRYTVINQTMQCPMECTYCVLQMYLEHPVITVHANMETAFQTVHRMLQEEPSRFFRFGTGELGDSLALDDWLNLSEDFTAFFSDKRNTLIEFKTKTNHVDGLLACSPTNAVVSWSVNPQAVVGTEELCAASLSDRLRAAKRCQDGGFILGFHFDPILHVPGWEDLYRGLIDHMFSVIDPSRVAWISLGTLRFPPLLKSIIQKRFPKTGIIYEEMIQGLDGKMRYLRPLRVDMYKKIYGWLKAYDAALFIYFCMEPPWVWEAVMGDAPASNGMLDYWFACSLFERFPTLGMVKPELNAYSQDRV